MLTFVLSLSVLGHAPSWKEIEGLTSEQKYEAAALAAQARLAQARKGSDDAELAKALIVLTRLRMALGGAESAVQQLRAETWPKSDVQRTSVELFYAATLANYFATYAYEIGRRERIDTRGAVDLKAWTSAELRAEIDRTYQAMWQRREALGRVRPAALGEFLVVNDFPPGIRDSLRDVVTFLWATELANSGGWTPAQNNEAALLDLSALIAGDAKASSGPLVSDAQRHPLQRLAAILEDLEAWHRRDGRPEGALNARLRRLTLLRASFTEADDRRRFIDDLERHVTAGAALPFSAYARATLAEWYHDAGDVLRARDVAAVGARAFPSSVGGRRCAHLVARYEAPAYALSSMRVDGTGKRSVELTHKNLSRLFFRAYRLQLRDLLPGPRTGGTLLPGSDELAALLRGAPSAAWSVELPATPDLREHRTMVTPPLSAMGPYAIVASALETFADAHNAIIGAITFASRLVLSVTQSPPDQAADVVVRDGANGAPLAGVAVELWRMRWNQPKQLLESQTTDAAGIAHFKGGRSSDFQYFLVARRGEELTIDEQGLSFWRSDTPQEDSALVYSDRAIYRPTQKLLWKVVAFTGTRATAALKTERGARLTVRLLDPNWQEVAKRAVTTNDFGAAWSEFEVPTGRPLGLWRLDVQRGDRSIGQATVRVEEYKRPTFEASFREDGPPAKLNAPVQLIGEARYTFGLPVTAGRVTWRVERTPVYPWYWWEWLSVPTQRAEVVASGTTSLRDDGTFSLSFTPRADARLAHDVSYRYTASADVTDEGGETRQATRAIRVGFVAVEATFAADMGFFREGAPITLGIRRTDLNGAGRAGRGTWRLVALQQPAEPLLPADEPPTSDPRRPAPSVVTPGDGLRSRIDPGYAPTATLHRWSAGAQQAAGVLEHAADGTATIALPHLPAGAWRVLYETKDDFGGTWSMATELLVTSDRAFPVKLSALVRSEHSRVDVGGTARFLIGSAFAGQRLLYEVHRAGRLVERRWLTAGTDPALVERRVLEEDRGGFTVTVTAVRDWQVMQFQESVAVPWDDKTLTLEFSTFRDTTRPGAKETFRVTVKGQGRALEQGAAEVLAYMYDQSLDLFGAQLPPSIPDLYPNRAYANAPRTTLGRASSNALSRADWFRLPDDAYLRDDALTFLDGWGIGGMGPRGGGGLRVLAKRGNLMASGAPPMEAAAAPAAPSAMEADAALSPQRTAAPAAVAPADAPPASSTPLRTRFAETAFFLPHLLTDAHGTASIEFTVPDSVTAWNVWAHAVTRDLRGGSTKRLTRSVKELMVRPYLPRFLREGDRASLQVAVNNAAQQDFSGTLEVDLIDPETQQSLAAEFGLAQAPRPFSVKAGQGTSLTVPITAPKRVGLVAFRVIARAGDVSDGELRPLPLLPSRLHLAQSRFVTLKDRDTRTMRFEALARDDDASRINEQLVVTVDAQLFYSVLSALPSLVRSPYECSEQTLNRFLSSGIVGSVFRDSPVVADMSRTLAGRGTRYEAFDALDPNRKMALEESPWLLEAQGRNGPGHDELVDVLEPRAVETERSAALALLQKMQTPQGGFPWFPGGPPSQYMTAYVLHGFAKALEFHIDLPKDMATRAWQYLADDFRRDVRTCMAHGACWESVTFMGYVASAFPDDSWLGGALTPAERKEMLDFSFAHWKQHSPYLKGMLALALHRANRPADAKLVFDSVMDSAKTTQDDGTFWQPEDRAWLWYHDTIEAHAFALRVLMELAPQDARRAGLVQWLLLNKKLGHWKSTRATAEVLYSLTKYLKAEHTLAVREETDITVGPTKKSLVFLPDVYTGKKNQLVIPGQSLDPKTQSSVTVSKTTKGFQFASATWHYSTEQLPKEGSGDLFHVERRAFKRVHQGQETTLVPLGEGAPMEVGDELEIQLSLRARQEAEYVHLRDPRGAGFEPENATSRYLWDLGLARYEEYRDSGTNFFFERLPPGEYTLKYRVRAATAGTFRVGPATLQSMYAPEFTAYSAGQTLEVRAPRP